MAEFRGRQEKGEVSGGEGRVAFWKFTVPWGPDDCVPPTHAGLVHLVAIRLLEGVGVERRTGCFQQLGEGSGPLFSFLRSRGKMCLLCTPLQSGGGGLCDFVPFLIRATSQSWLQVHILPLSFLKWQEWGAWDGRGVQSPRAMLVWERTVHWILNSPLPLGVGASSVTFGL